MYGDRFGSPGRDDRQDGPEQQYAAGRDARVSHDRAPSDDLKVAGAPIAQPAVPDFSTAAMPAPGTAGTPEAAEAASDIGDTLHDLGGPVPALGDTRHDLRAVPADPEPWHDAGTPQGGAAGDEFAAMRRGRTSPNLARIGVIAAAAVVVLGGGTAGAMALTGGSHPATKTVQPRQQAQADAPAPLTEAQRKQIESQRRTELKKKALRAARNEEVRPMLFAKGEPPPTPKPTDTAGSAGNPVPAGEAQQIARALLPSYGWSPSTQFGCLVNMWNRESGWRVHAANPSGAYGIPQALPGSKMSSAGPDWQNNATTQIKWGLGYIKDRYNSPCGAWSYWQAHGSY